MKSNYDRLQELFSPTQLRGLAHVQATLQEDPLYLEKAKEDEKCHDRFSGQQEGNA